MKSCHFWKDPLWTRGWTDGCLGGWRWFPWSYPVTKRSVVEWDMSHGIELLDQETHGFKQIHTFICKWLTVIVFCCLGSLFNSISGNWNFLCTMTCVFFHVFLLFFVWISQVGASGSGKSTIAALLFRHYDPEVRDCPVVPGESW